MLLKEGVITQQLHCHAIDPGFAGEPLVQEIDALQRQFPVAPGDVRRADGGLAAARISGRLQFLPGGRRIGPGVTPRGCLEWHHQEDQVVEQISGRQSRFCRWPWEVRKHPWGLLLSDHSDLKETNDHQLPGSCRKGCEVFALAVALDQINGIVRNSHLIPIRSSGRFSGG